MVSRIFRLASVLLLGTMLSFSQQFSSLSGTVTDPSGAVIPGATVTIESVDRGFTREAITDEGGRYVFPQIQPGRFKVTAKASGFPDTIVNNVILEVNQPGKVNVAFEKVGQVAETISVSAETVQINTTDATVGNTIGTVPILQVPLFARNMAGLLVFQPGVTSFSGSNLDDRNGSVNGGKADQSNVTLDGIDVNQQNNRLPFTTVLRVTPDSTQEFRSTTTGANADQGRSSGAQVQLVTKSGTNGLHGSVYHFHRNTITAANSFFNNAAGVKRTPLLINIPGASIGGPIVRNKAFFFVNYEGRRDASAANVVRTVPSALLRQGVLQYINRTGGVSQLDPAQIRALDPAGLGVSPAVQQVFNSFPQPNDPTLGDGLNTQGFRFTAPVTGKQDTYIARFDYTPGTNHSLFLRGQLQNDRDLGTPQFPGEQANSAGLVNAKGIAFGWTWVVTPKLISTFRYGLTRRSNELTGIQNAAAVSFRGLSDRNGLTRGVSRQIPVHMITQDFAYNSGAHDIRFGMTARAISNQSRNFNNAYNDATTNVSWLRGTGADIQPADLATSFRTAYGDAAVAIMGIITQGRGRYNYNIDGSLIPTGTPVSRNFRNEEYEWYLQDTWRMRRNLTLTLGVRHSLMPPIYEANNIQLSSNIPVADFFNTRGGLALQGKGQDEAGKISYILANGPGGRPIYPYHLKNFAPRASLAWSPDAKDGFLKKLLGGPGKTSIRAGWGMFYDIIGQPLTATYDANAFGLATSLLNPSGQLTSITAPRFSGLNSLPSQLIRPAPPGAFPATPPSTGAGSFAITNTIDDNLQMPYTMNMNLTVGREFGSGWFLEGSYVGRLSRKSLIDRDLAMPTNLKDPASGQTYYEAATILERQRRARTPIGQVQRLPFFENFYRNLASGGMSATQVWYETVGFYPFDTSSALADLDHFCDPDCGIRPNLMFNPQFSALSALSSVGGGSYHAAQVTLRKRFSQGLVLDFNYTLSKSIDLASRAENAGTFGGASPAGFLVNPWEPGLNKGVSDYDARHIYSAYMVYELPFGKGRRYGSGAGGFLNALIGGWQVAPSWQQSTELPYYVGNGRNWPTNWNITSAATPVGDTRPSTRTKNAPAVAGASGPNMFADPAGALREWDFTLPGQVGSRNTIRIDGAFNINLNVAKRFYMPWSEGHTLQFRWETFNLTNAVRFGIPSITLGSAATFGKYQTQSNDARQMQFGLRYEF